jgi:hypothetical protein
MASGSVWTEREQYKSLLDGVPCPFTYVAILYFIYLARMFEESDELEESMNS